MDSLEAFRRAEADLISAINGFDGKVAPRAEIERLESLVRRARKECIEVGLDVQSIAERIFERRKEEETRIRQIAAKAIQVVPLVPPRLRSQIASCTALLTMLFTFASAVGFWWALAAGAAAYGFTIAALSELFPTPAIRIARLAAEANVDVSDLWEPGSRDLRDYQVAYRMQLNRLFKRGDDAWIRVR